VTAACSASWLLEPAIKSGARTILVTDVTDADLALPSYVPPPLPGMKPSRLGPGVFGYKSGATLQVWPPDRHVRNLPNIAKPFRVVLDPVIVLAAYAPYVVALRYTVRWGLNEVSTQEMGMSCTAQVGIADSDFSVAARAKISIAAIRAPDSSHLVMPHVCGYAAGLLLQSKVGRWLADPMPATVVLNDALGRRVTLNDVMPVLDISAIGRKFRLCGEVADEIRYVEIHG